ncbi:MAG TPA: hypothetical protein VHI31_05270, partial [Actinomycetota bacterium]|nr:hypothetical protein [Actinomycetota bacterium]
MFWGIVAPTVEGNNSGVAASRTQAEGTAGQAHWDAAYKRLTASGVSWYQPHATISVDIVQSLGLPLQTPMIDVGGGASTFADSLVGMGYSD